MTLESQRKWLPWIAAAFGMLLTILVYYPGYVSLDSLSQLAEARSGIYKNWHPPIMGWVWSFFDKIFPGPFGMLLLFSAMFWVGLALFVTGRIKNSWMAVLIVLTVGLFPAIFALLGMVWKDVGLGASLILSAGLLTWASEKRKIGILALAFPFLFFAFCVRHEAGFAIVPMLIWAGVIWQRIRFLERDFSIFGIFAFAIVSFLLLLGSKIILERALLQNNSGTSPTQVIWIHDLAGLSLEAQENLFPPYLTAANPNFNLGDLARVYDPTSSLSLFKEDGTYRRFPAAKNDEELNSLQEYWRRAIRNHPERYLRNRWEFFRASLAIGQSVVIYPFQDRVVENSLGFTMRQSRLTSIVMSFLNWIRNSWVFRAWVYLLAGLLFFIIGLVTRSLETSLLALSGLLYEGLHFFFLPAGDFRYHWWMVLSVFLCAICLLERRLKPRF